MDHPWSVSFSSLFLFIIVYSDSLFLYFAGKPFIQHCGFDRWGRGYEEKERTKEEEEEEDEG